MTPANERLPELPLDPEDWSGSDEWAERADIRAARLRAMREDLDV